MNPTEGSQKPYLQILDRRLRAYRHLETRIARLERLFVFLRLFLFVLFLGLTYIFSKLGENSLMYVLLGIVVLIFTYVMYRHSQLKSKKSNLSKLIRFVQTDISRLDIDWSEIPDEKPFCRFKNNDIAIDLNIVGRHSLVQLIDTTSSLEARDFLLSCLLEPCLDQHSICRRQNIVKSLVPRYLLLAKLRLAGERIDEKVLSGEAVLSQLRDNPYPSWGRVLLWASCFLAVVNIVIFYFLGMKYFVLTFTVYITLVLLSAKYSKNAYARIVDVKLNLDRINQLFNILENRHDLHAAELYDHLSPMRDSKSSPTNVTKSLGRIIDALSIRAFPLVHVIMNIVMPWDQIFTLRLEIHRDNLLQHLPLWLKVTAEVEAYCALAHFSRLNPEYCDPKMFTQESSYNGDFFVANLGHPMLSESLRVVNDLEISNNCRMGIITGSNMSGKSAFLRTVGINICLAQAGAVVCATEFKSPIFHLVTCINVVDDLENGKSLFYREIEKLRDVLAAFDRAGNHSVMFLIDEILKGTNNKERIVGGKRFLKGLSDKVGYGLVSTHDLEFANLADTLPNLFNVHFQETIVGSEMIFDHKLRPGKCQTTNALRIMEMEKII